MCCFGFEGGTIGRVVAEIAGTVEIPIQTVAAGGVDEWNPYRHVVLHHVVVVLVTMVQCAVLHLSQSVDGLAC